jgi:hypothetical protein
MFDSLEFVNALMVYTLVVAVAGADRSVNSRKAAHKIGRRAGGGRRHVSANMEEAELFTTFFRRMGVPWGREYNGTSRRTSGRTLRIVSG